MRIACLHLPSFPLQACIRRRPYLAGQPVAVVLAASPGRESTGIAATSRAAHDRGVRTGQPAAAARALCPALEIVACEREELTSAAESAADVLRSLSDQVEVVEPSLGGHAHLSIYLAVPRGVRGARFGELTIATLSQHGFAARAGVADDRFTAWAAAWSGREAPGGSAAGAVVAVPRGGSAAFLAPLPLELLPLDDDVRGMLRALRVTTLGEFAALPPPSISRPQSSWSFDLQDLARGEGSSRIFATPIDDTISERVELGAEVDGSMPAAFAARPVVDRVANRLRARGDGAAALAVKLGRAGDQWVAVDREVGAPTASPHELLSEIVAAIQIANRQPAATFSTIELSVSRAMPLRDSGEPVLPGVPMEPISRWVRQPEGSRAPSRPRTARPRACVGAGEKEARVDDSA